MTKLTSMKITAAERKAREKEYSKPIGPGGDVYPYGLTIRLENDSLEKLDMSSLPKTGKKVRVTALCSVISTREEKSSHGGRDERRRSLELQIEQLALSTEPGSAVEAVDDALKDA